MTVEQVMDIIIIWKGYKSRVPYSGNAKDSLIMRYGLRLFLVLLLCFWFQNFRRWYHVREDCEELFFWEVANCVGVHLYFTQKVSCEGLTIGQFFVCGTVEGWCELVERVFRLVLHRTSKTLASNPIL